MWRDHQVFRGDERRRVTIGTVRVALVLYVAALVVMMTTRFSRRETKAIRWPSGDQIGVES